MPNEEAKKPKQNDDIKLALCAAKKPIIGLAALELFWYGVERVSFLSFLAGDYLYVVKLALFLWAGYIAANLSKFKLQTAVLAGVFAGVAVMIIDMVLGSIFYPGFYGFGFGSLIQWVFIAAIMSTIGHFLALRLKQKPKNSPENK